ncbi:MAG: anhydro-N-acetylmuramic acid kinase [Acidobacteriota bacterium]
MKESKLIVGLMTGTSLDGIDAALVKVTGSGIDTHVTLRHFLALPFDDELRNEILRAASGRAVTTLQISQLNFLLGEMYADAVLKLCKKARVGLHELDLIGSHGQTVFHQSEPSDFCGRRVASTLQIGEATILAERTGVTTVCDFRPRDMAAGGKGAPLIPYVDYLLFRDSRLGRVLLNIGGIANVTLIPSSAELAQVKAFDTGPGNMVMDALMQRLSHGEKRFDHGGSLARSGQVLSNLLEQLLSHPYFAMVPPKTAGREQFGEDYVATILGSSESARPEDLLCTATELTARSAIEAITRFVIPESHVDELIVSGGGAHNDFLMERLRLLLPRVRALKTDDLGLSVDAKEAVGFAVLANETFHLNCGNLPSATGARHQTILGKVIYGSNYRRLRETT